MFQVRQSVHHDFERNGNLLLDFLCRASRPLRDDLDVIVGHVGIGFDRQPLKGNDAPEKQQRSHYHHQETVAEREFDDCPDHGPITGLLLRGVLQHERVGDHLVARRYAVQ